ncbi:hypothetical protein BBOH_0652 [Bifidobacterium bohemicum DSM 22767]|uniref:Colicin transporter n=2 Tax=Bifidobacterium bohemicum TaxID=638617 RepID=A0A086ZH48_9BIFI|nr:hypothetical protein [Bifidobacterium bohemicum]KFI45848.1 hypothetical protein BBOH_0652 [Bifidobacterium bohemicum DSM 22767]
MTGTKDENVDVENETTLPPPVGDGSGVGPEGGGRVLPRRWWRGRRVWVVGVVVLVLVAVAAGVGWWWRSAVGSANGSCRGSVSEVRLLRSRGLGAGVGSARRVARADVADAGTVDAFAGADAKLSKAVKAPLPSCSAGSPGAARAESDGAARAVDSLRGARSEVVRRARRVLASRDAKMLADARASLGSRRDAGRALLDSSAGSVADESTRDVLSGAVDRAGGLLDGKGSTLKDVRAAGKALDDAMSAVNASVQAKADADAQAAAAAAAAQSAQSAQSAPVQRQAVRRSAVPSRPSYGGGQGRYVPAAPAARPAPAPSGQPSGNSGFDLTVTPNPACAPGHTGLCPIG